MNLDPYCTTMLSSEQDEFRRRSKILPGWETDNKVSESRKCFYTLLHICSFDNDRFSSTKRRLETTEGSDAERAQERDSHQSLFGYNDYKKTRADNVDVLLLAAKLKA